jgi:hypothetical protein
MPVLLGTGFGRIWGGPRIHRRHRGRAWGRLRGVVAADEGARLYAPTQGGANRSTRGAGVCKVFQTVQRGYTYPPLSGPQLRQFACVST